MVDGRPPGPPRTLTRRAPTSGAIAQGRSGRRFPTVAKDRARSAATPARPATVDATSASSPLRSWRPPSIEVVGDRSGDRRRPPLQLVGRAERVAGAVHEQARDDDRRQVLDPQGVAACPAGAADRRWRPRRPRPAAAVRRRRRRRPSSTSARPSSARRRRSGRASIAASSSRTAASSFGGRSGARRPSLRYGKSARTVVHPGATRSLHGDEGRLVPAGPGAREQQQRVRRRRGIRMRRRREGSCAPRRARTRRCWPRRGRRRDRGGRPASVIRNCAVTSLRVGVGLPGGKPSTSSAHALGSARVDRAVELVPARWAISGAPTGPRQRIALCSTGAMTWRIDGIEPLDGVDGAEHLGHARAGRVEVEADLLAVAEQPMRRQGQPVTIDLEPVPQPGLDDPVVAVDLIDQAVDVGDQLVGDVPDVAGDDGTEQQAAEAWRRVDGQHQVAERDPPRRSERAGVPHLQLRQQHPRQDTGGFPAPPRRTKPSGAAKASGLHVLADEGAQGLGGADDVGGRRRVIVEQGTRARRPPRPIWPMFRPPHRMAAASGRAGAAVPAGRRDPCGRRRPGRGGRTP